MFDYILEEELKKKDYCDLKKEFLETNDICKYYNNERFNPDIDSCYNFEACFNCKYFEEKIK